MVSVGKGMHEAYYQSKMSELPLWFDAAPHSQPLSRALPLY